MMMKNKKKHHLLGVFILLIIFRKRMARIFSFYAALTFFSQTVFQNMGVSETYGFSFITVNVIMFPLVGLVWVLDAFVQKNDYDYRSRSVWQYWAVPLAFFALWAPKTLENFLSLDLAYIVTSGTTFGFCLMVPVYLSILFMSYPRVNMVTLSVTSVVGFIIAIYNMMIVVMSPENWWHGIIHTPLLVISFAGIVLSLRKKQGDED